MKNRKSILINLLPIKSGGGLQNCVSFIKGVQNNSFIWIVRRDSILHSLCERRGFKVIAVKDSYISRVIFELSIRFRFSRGDVCFTYFGPTLLTSASFFHNINGFAYSNLLHPNINFWGFCSPLTKLKKQLIDYYRMKQICKADEVIFETNLLLSKAENRREFEGKSLHVVRMAPSLAVIDPAILDTEKYSFLASDRFTNVAYIAGAHPNKRIHKLVQLAKAFKKAKVNVRFVLTLPESDYWTQIQDRIAKESLYDYFVNLGPIPPTDVSSLMFHCDGMINLALLESFSNNVVEAWALKKILFITDDDWSRAECVNGAVYLDVENIEGEIHKFHVLFEQKFKENLIQNGQSLLATMPTVDEKITHYLDIINKR